MQKRKAYLGIDPGRHGGFGLIDEDGKFVECGLFPYKLEEFDARLFAKVLNHFKNTYNLTVIFELNYGMPGNSSDSTFNFGKITGELISVVKVLAIPYKEVQPTEWKKNVLKGMSWKADTVRFSSPKGISKKEKELLRIEHDKKYKAANAKAKREAKLVSCEYVFKTYPDADIMTGVKHNKPNDGMADGICMAKYGYLHDRGQTLT